MDMIYTDAARRELGVLQEYELDLAIGEDENDFALTMARASHCCAPGAFVYAENTECGGIVDALRSRPAADEITCTGRTWHGILNSKVIEPDSGEDYLTVSGDANEVLSGLVDRFGIGGSGELMHGKNLVKSYHVTQASKPYTVILQTEIDELFPNTEYMLSFIGAAGLKFYLNENLFTWKTVTATGEWQSVQVKTKADVTISKDNGLQYIAGYGWIIAKNSDTNTVVASLDKVQIELGTVATEYEPYREFYSSPGLFSASAAASGIPITEYRFPRYCKGYDGIRAMLAAHGAKLVLRMQNGMVTLSAAPAVRLEDADTDDASVSLDVTRAYHTVNHLICLGRGELAARTVLHLYADATGSISTTKTQTGLDEITEVYDYPSVESIEDLEQKGRQKLAELWQPAQVEAAMDASAGDLDVGDSMRAIDEVTGIEVAATITKKIVTVRNGRVTVDYKVGV